MALTKVTEPEREKAKLCAERALEAAEEHKLIEANPQVGASEAHTSILSS